jgi:hypothetical protein
MSVERPESLKPVHNLFPVSKQSATTSFESIFSALESGKVKVDILEDKIEQFNKENSVLYDFLSVTTLLMYESTEDEEVLDLYLLGALFAYTTLREEALRRGGALPVITDDILRTTIIDLIDIEQNRIKLVNANSEKDLDSFLKILEERRVKMIENFFQQEPELGARLQEYLSGFKKVHAEAIQLGILDVYSVFRTNHEIEKFRSKYSSLFYFPKR